MKLLVALQIVAGAGRSFSRPFFLFFFFFIHVCRLIFFLSTFRRHCRIFFFFSNSSFTLGLRFTTAPLFLHLLSPTPPPSSSLSYSSSSPSAICCVSADRVRVPTRSEHLEFFFLPNRDLIFLVHSNRFEINSAIVFVLACVCVLNSSFLLLLLPLPVAHLTHIHTHTHLLICFAHLSCVCVSSSSQVGLRK